MAAPRIELVMSEFTATRANAGGARLSTATRLDPTLESFLAVFPDAAVVLYTDAELPVPARVRRELVAPPFSTDHPRYGWRAHDFYQAHGLLQSRAEVAIAMDSDMRIVSPDFRAIEHLARRFGLAVPMNPRQLARVDGLVGSDSTYRLEEDETRGTTSALNLTPIAFSTVHSPARRVLERYLALLEQSPGRGAVHLSRASYEEAFSPCLLPAPWCVCSPADFESPHVWRNAIALHVGHADVEPRWRAEGPRAAIAARLNRLKHLLR